MAAARPHAELASAQAKNEDVEMKIKVRIQKIVSPNLFYVFFEAFDDRLHRLHCKMTKYYESTPEEERKWALGDICVVMYSNKNVWERCYRGVIEHISRDQKLYTVRLKDKSSLAQCSRSALRTMRAEFSEVPDGPVKCHLDGVIPCDGGRNWSSSTVKAFRVMLTKDFWKFFISVKKGLQDDDDSLAVKLWVTKTIDQGPFAPFLNVWSMINEILILHRYAVPDTRSPVSKKTENLAQEMDGKQQPPSKTVMHLTLFEALNPNTDWLPAKPLENMDGDFFVTFVDPKGSIYIRENDADENLKLIQQRLDYIFDDSNEEFNVHWQAGDPCIVHYVKMENYGDKVSYGVRERGTGRLTEGHWYRGRVMKVIKQNHSVEVMFVDYGYTEVLYINQLHKQLLLEDIPLQCHRCDTDTWRMRDSPSNSGQQRIWRQWIYMVTQDKWPKPVLAFIRQEIEGKVSRVELQPPATEDGHYKILTLTTPCGALDLACQLMTNNYVTKISTFTPFVIPDNVLMLHVYVEKMEGNTALSLYIDDSAGSDVVGNYLFNLQNLHTKIHVEAAEMPVILDPLPGMECIAHCPNKDGMWVRATVMEVFPEDKSAVVSYVDFGNKEVYMSLESLKETKEEWTILPTRSYSVNLYGVALGPAYDPETYLNKIKKCFEMGIFLMYIQEREPNMQVELYNTATRCLAYLPLLEQSILTDEGCGSENMIALDYYY